MQGAFKVVVALAGASAAWLAAGAGAEALGLDGWWPLDRLGAVFLALWGLEAAFSRVAPGRAPA